MKKIHQFMMATVVAICSTQVMANNVAVWDSRYAIVNSHYAKAKLTEADKQIKPKQKLLETYQNNIESLQQQYAQQHSQLSDAKKAEMEKQLQDNLDKITTTMAEIQTIVEKSENDVFAKVSPKMPAIQESIVKQKNIDVLIDNRDRIINFVKPEWDVTEDFIKKINEQVK